MRLPAWFAFFHKWLALIVGIQIIFWVVSGLVFTILPIDEVRGRHNAADQEPMVISEGHLRASLSSIVAAHAPDGIREARVRSLLGQSIYDLTLISGDHVLVDTRSGGLVTVNEAMARAIATADFSGDGSLVELTRLTEGWGNIAAPILPGAHVLTIQKTQGSISPKERAASWRAAMPVGGCLIFCGCCTSWTMTSGRVLIIR